MTPGPPAPPQVFIQDPISFAVFRFAVVLFTFFGITYLLPGMHAYA